MHIPETRKLDIPNKGRVNLSGHQCDFKDEQRVLNTNNKRNKLSPKHNVCVQRQAIFLALVSYLY